MKQMELLAATTPSRPAPGALPAAAEAAGELADELNACVMEPRQCKERSAGVFPIRPNVAGENDANGPGTTEPSDYIRIAREASIQGRRAPSRTQSNRAYGRARLRPSRDCDVCDGSAGASPSLSKRM